VTEKWVDIPVADDASTPPASVESGRYVKVGLTSDHLIFVWVAGPSRAYRVPAPISDRPPTRVTWTDPDTGERVGKLRPFTADDQEMTDEFVNYGLEQAGLPHYLSEFDWFVKVPEHIVDADSLADALKEKNLARDEAHALEIITETYNALLTT
jgi:hypothetical protein